MGAVPACLRRRNSEPEPGRPHLNHALGLANLLLLHPRSRRFDELRAARSFQDLPEPVAGCGRTLRQITRFCFADRLFEALHCARLFAATALDRASQEERIGSSERKLLLT